MDRRIGHRIAYWRERRRLSQVDLAALLNRSLRTVESLEGGQRQSDPRLSVLEDAARALRIPVEWLLRDGPERACVDAVELEEIWAALTSYDVVTGTDADPRPPLSVAVLRKRVAHGWDAFQMGGFGQLGRLVPVLIIEASRATVRHDGDGRLAAYRALSMTLCLTEAIAIKFGSPDLAQLAGHRAVIAAERSGSPVIIATAVRHLADAMTHHGQPHAAARIAAEAAQRLAPDLVDAGPSGLSTLGMLYLKAAIAQATASSAAGADDKRAASAARAVPGLLAEAKDRAGQLGDDGDGNALWTAFGTSNVALYQLAAHVQLAEGTEGVSVALAMTVPEIDVLPRERRAHRLVDLAHAYTLAGNRERAVDTLLKAEGEAEQEVICRPRTRQLVTELGLLGVGNREGQLRALSARCGLPG